MRRRSDRKKSTDVQSSPAPPSRRSTRRLRKSPQPSDLDKNEQAEKLQAGKEKDHELKPSEDTKTIIEDSIAVIDDTIQNECINSQVENNEKRITPIPEENSNIRQEEMQKDSVALENLKQDNIQEQQEVLEVHTKTPIDDGNTNIDNIKEVLKHETPSDAKRHSESNEESQENDEPQKPTESEELPKGTFEKDVSGKTIGKNDEDISEKDALNRNGSESNRSAAMQDNNDVNLSIQKPHESGLTGGTENYNRDTDNQLNNSVNKNTSSNVSLESTRIRKRKWLSKKSNDSKRPVLSISTDSLKELIADVQPVPLSDVRLESSSEIEELESEREEGEDSGSDDDRSRPSISNNKVDAKLAQISTSASSTKRKIETTTTTTVENVASSSLVTTLQTPRTPSPARNNSSNILYITNLVRPFTVLQLKGLLARTGNIIEDGFWIDRIKSKCYVHFETEDQAIETRHALHGIRWPVSNPKCLNVEFSTKTDMDEAILSTKDDKTTLSQDFNKDNYIIGGWNNDHNEINEKKSNRPVREWDVGKKENLARMSREMDMGYNKDRLGVTPNDTEKREKDRRDRRGARRELQSSSLSPVRKQKRESDPPLRLLDDLFRKTKATPCIYWLPLTPEQIAEKEAFRQKRIEEHKERMKQREIDVRNRENEKDRNRRERERDREKDRDQRRRSRSRDRRRY